MFTHHNLLLSVNLYDVLFFGIPAVVFALFILSLILYVSAKKRDKKQPGSVSQTSMKARTFFLVLTIIFTVPLFIFVLGYVGLVFMIIAFM